MIELLYYSIIFLLFYSLLPNPITTPYFLYFYGILTIIFYLSLFILYKNWKFKLDLSFILYWGLGIKRAYNSLMTIWFYLLLCHFINNFLFFSTLVALICKVSCTHFYDNILFLLIILDYIIDNINWILFQKKFETKFRIWILYR